MLLLAVSQQAEGHESSATADTGAQPAAIVISGGTDPERRLIDGFLLRQLHGLASNAHPLLITIIPDTDMRKLVLTGGGDTNTGEGDTRQTTQATNTEPNSVEAAADNNTAPDNPDSDGEVDAIYTEASSDSPTSDQNMNRAEITLLKGEGTDDFSEAFLHEFGHHLWFTSVNQQEMSDFKALYAQATRTQTFVSDYAAVSAEEDFAEAFAYYELTPKLLAKRDPVATQYLIKLLARIHATEINTPALNIQVLQESGSTVDGAP